jgi:hypothetical protein
LGNAPCFYKPLPETWDDEVEVLPGVTPHRIWWPLPRVAGSCDSADGRGVLLSGDTVVGTADEHWVSFRRSYPNKIPLCAGTVQKVTDRLTALDFDRLYDNRCV